MARSRKPSPQRRPRDMDGGWHPAFFALELPGRLLLWIPLMMFGGGGSYRCRFCGAAATPFGLAWSTLFGLVLVVLFGAMTATLVQTSVGAAIIPAMVAGLGLWLVIKPAKKQVVQGTDK